MKHKPMLLRKINDKRRGNTREVIGLIGTHHGVGVTHTGLMLAFYMAEELGKKTALLECNNHRDMNLLRQLYEWSREDLRSFSFGRISCYQEVDADAVTDVFGKDYECIIMDFGTELNANREEFLRCGTKLVIGGRSDLDRQKLHRFIDASKSLRGYDTWKLLIPMAKDKTLGLVKNEINKKVWSVPENDEPTLPSCQTNQFFDELFRT